MMGHIPRSCQQPSKIAYQAELAANPQFAPRLHNVKIPNAGQTQAVDKNTQYLKSSVVGKQRKTQKVQVMRGSLAHPQIHSPDRERLD